MIPFTLATGTHSRTTSRDYDKTDLVADIDFGNPLSYDPDNGITELTGDYTPSGINGNPVYDQDGINGYMEVDGVGDNFYYKNSNQFITYNTKNSTNPEWTVEAWIKFITINNKILLDVYPANSGILTTRAEAYFQMALVNFPGYNTWYMRYNPGNGNSTSSSALTYYNNYTQQATLNDWKHIVFTGTTTNTTIYVNNTSIMSIGTSYGPNIIDSGVQQRLGLVGVPGYTSGSDQIELACFRYYDTAFNSTRVQAHFDATKGRFGIT